MTDTISTTIDAAGRVVIPKALRDAAGLVPGASLQVRVRDGRVEIEVAARKLKIVKRGSVRVAVSEEPGEPLTASVVAATQRLLRDRNG